MTSLEITLLDKAFGSQSVLTGLSLSTAPGSLTAILGPSGSGKTTLLRVIAGFERADQGTVALGGKTVDGDGCFVPPERRRIGYVPQEGSLFPHLTVERNIAFGLARADRRNSRRVGELIEMVSLTGLARRYPHQLSGGQQQRVALARALAISPEIVLLDEPFSSLDASLRASVRSDVRRVLSDGGMTTLLVTHDQDEALSLADRVAVIRAGSIGQYDTPERLYRRPGDPSLARSLGDANLIPGLLMPGTRTVATALGELTLDPSVDSSLAAQAPLVVLVRPEQVELSPEPRLGQLAGRIVDHEYYGHDAVIRVLTDWPSAKDTAAGDGDGLTHIIARTSGSGTVLPPGTRVGIRAHGAVVAWPADRG
jgi:iron(III) transport system ATP-binding protein